MTLRTRLAVLTAAAVALAVILASTVAYLGARREQRAALDEVLRTQAVESSLRAAGFARLLENPSIGQAADPFRSVDTFFQIVREDE